MHNNYNGKFICYAINSKHDLFAENPKIWNNQIMNHSENFITLDRYFRAANYLSAAQLYLCDNPLLERPLIRTDIKNRILGHWGTIVGQNFIYAHLSRAIKKFNQSMVLLSGPGHGGNFFIAINASFSNHSPIILV